jgi:4-hydroxy-2-oxoheptanedioate aldolase
MTLRPRPHPRLASAWDAGRAAVGGWVSGGGAFSLTVYRHAGYDYVGLDCQHSTLSEAEAAALLVASEPSYATLVRVSTNNAALIGRLADAGADGIIVPMVDSAADAARAVAAVSYPPAGVRSFGPIRSELRDAPLSELSARVSVFVMIETRDGLENVEQICQTPGITGVYVGPADLSIGLGLDPRQALTTSQLAGPLERIQQACKDSSVIFGIHLNNGALGQRWIERGAQLVTLGTDGAIFRAAAKAQLAEATAPSEPER